MVLTGCSGLGVRQFDHFLSLETISVNTCHFFLNFVTIYFEDLSLSAEPNYHLRTNQNFITFVWFAVKRPLSIREGSRYYWNLLRLSRFSVETSLNVTNKVLQSNAYLAHPEDLLLAISTWPHFTVPIWAIVNNMYGNKVCTLGNV